MALSAGTWPPEMHGLQNPPKPAAPRSPRADRSPSWIPHAFCSPLLCNSSHNQHVWKVSQAIEDGSILSPLGVLDSAEALAIRSSASSTSWLPDLPGAGKRRRALRDDHTLASTYPSQDTRLLTCGSAAGRDPGRLRLGPPRRLAFLALGICLEAFQMVLVPGLILGGLHRFQASRWWSLECLDRSPRASPWAARFSFFVNLPYVTGTERLKHVTLDGPTGSGKTASRHLPRWRRSPSRRRASGDRSQRRSGRFERTLIFPGREGDVIIFDITDTEFPLGFNPLSGIPPEGRTLWRPASSSRPFSPTSPRAARWCGTCHPAFSKPLAQPCSISPSSYGADFQGARGLAPHQRRPVREFFAVEFEENLRRRR